MKNPNMEQYMIQNICIYVWLGMCRFQNVSILKSGIQLSIPETIPVKTKLILSIISLK